MHTPSFDPGLTQRYDGPLRRVINPDGSFNVARHGTTWRDVNPYLYLVSTSWPRFFSWILLSYVTTNCIFAVIYFLLGPGTLAAAFMQPRPTASCSVFSSVRRRLPR